MLECSSACFIAGFLLTIIISGCEFLSRCLVQGVEHVPVAEFAVVRVCGYLRCLGEHLKWRPSSVHILCQRGVSWVEGYVGEEIDATFEWIWSFITLWLDNWALRRKRRNVLLKSRCVCSKRAQSVIDRLDMWDMSTMLDEEDLNSMQPLKAAYILSRRARMGLHYPKYSPDNERIVSDYIQKNLPVNMRLSHRQSCLPLAVKLTFVKSLSEVHTQHMFSKLRSLPDMVEEASY